MQQLRTFLLQNIPADVSFFELYSGTDINTLALVKTNIIPDKFGIAKVILKEYYRAPFVYYKWKAVDVFGNRSDFSDSSVIELDNDQLFNKFVLEEITPDSKVSLLETDTPVTLVGVPAIQGFRRYRAGVKKNNTQYTSFSRSHIFYSDQNEITSTHSVYIQVQPAITYPGEKIRIFWRVEAGLDGSVNSYPQLFNSSSPINLSGVIEDVAPSSNTTYTLTSNGLDGVKTASSALQVIPDSSSNSSSTTFSASLITVNEGSSTTLNWNASSASEVYIDNGIGAVSLSGSQLVSPQKDTTYTLIAHFSDGSVIEKVVSVSVTKIPIITRFTGEKTTITLGQALHLVWGVSNVKTITIDQGIGTVFDAQSDTSNVLDNIEVFPTSSTTYTLTATNFNGISVQATFFVQVN